MYTHVAVPEGVMIDDEGVWIQSLRRPDGSATRPALFLDRDGVIVEEVDHLHRPVDVRVVEDAAAVIAAANGRGHPVVIATNQSGIGQALFGWDDFIAVQDRILGELALNGAFVDGVFACPHHPRAKPPYDHPDHPARKPNPGMLLRAARLLPIALEESWIIGDRARDIAAGRNAGLAGGLHLSTGHGSSGEEQAAAAALAQAGGYQVLKGTSLGDALAALPLFAASP